jgi:polygalacturonase
MQEIKRAMPTVDKRDFLIGSLAGAASWGLAVRASATPESAHPGPVPQVDSAAPNLMSPPAAQTADSIAILWSNPANVAVDGYDVYLDGRRVAMTKHTDHTFHDLKAARTYDISVQPRLIGGALLDRSVIQVTTKPRAKTHDIGEFGAIGDGKALNTPAIQKAIDGCRPGDIVRIPKGVFLSGAIFLKSEMTLHLDEGAVLLGSPETRDYPIMRYRFEGREKNCYASLVNTRDANGRRWHNIAITGQGTINGNGVALREREMAEKAGERGRAICIRDTDGLYLQGITVRQSPAWCVHPIYCNGVTVNGVSIHTKYDEAGQRYPHMVNGDGLDPDSCRDVFIFNCHIASQDDCIAIKSGRDEEGRAVGIPSENLRISHCHFTSGFGVAIGSEMSGGVRNVLVEDCVFEDTFGIASVKAPRGRGNMIENIVYRDCTLKNRSDEHRDGRWFRGGLYVDQFYSIADPDPAAAQPKNDGTALIRNITFQNIVLETIGGNAIYLAGLPESPLENIRLNNVTARGIHGFIAYNVRGLGLNSVSVEVSDGKAMQFVNVET